MGDIRMIDGFYDHDTGQIGITMQEDITDILQHNLDRQKDGSNGWTKDRAMRQVGAIPYSFLTHPEFRTVDKMLHVGPADGHIIVK